LVRFSAYRGSLYRSEHMSETGTLRITLTPEQKEQVWKAIGKDAEAVELTVEELEERIAPMTFRGKQIANPQ